LLKDGAQALGNALADLLKLANTASLRQQILGLAPQQAGQIRAGIGRQAGISRSEAQDNPGNRTADLA